MSTVAAPAATVRDLHRRALLWTLSDVTAGGAKWGVIADAPMTCPVCDTAHAFFVVRERFTSGARWSVRCVTCDARESA